VGYLFLAKAKPELGQYGEKRASREER